MRFEMVLAVAVLSSFTSPALACLGGGDGNDGARIEAQQICGFKLYDNPPKCEYDRAVIDTDWVLFRDSGALNRARSEFSSCGYYHGYYSVRGAVIAAQMHNKSAMCNLLACNYEIEYYYKELIDSDRFPKFWDD